MGYFHGVVWSVLTKVIIQCLFYTVIEDSDLTMVNYYGINKHEYVSYPFIHKTYMNSVTSHIFIDVIDVMDVKVKLTNRFVTVTRE